MKMTAKAPLTKSYRLISDFLATTCYFGKNVYSSTGWQNLLVTAAVVVWMKVRDLSKATVRL